jgi:hypothetical protein
MLRKLSFTAVILILTASWVCAGNLGALASAAASQAATPLYLKPGALVKAEYKSGLNTIADEDTQSINLKAENVAANSDQRVSARPAIAFKPKSSAAMAPPPRVEAVGLGTSGLVAEARQDSMDLEGDLEKDLVLSPPPQKSESTKEIEAKPVVTEAKPVKEKVTAVAEPKKTSKKPATTKIRKVSPGPQYAGSPKPIRKVHPLTQDSWRLPAGTYENRNFPTSPTICAPSRFNASTNAPSGMMPSQYVTSAPRPSLGAPGMGDRIVRDGVTIKLAPASAPVTAPAPYPSDQRDDALGADLLSTAVEIIGLPFAFISSLF